MDEITFRDLQPGDAGWVAQRHGALYWAYEGYDIRFEALVLRLLADFVESRTEHERAWIAVDAEGGRQGCIFTTRPVPGTAKLRMFLVEPAMRGTGLARRMLDLLIDHCRATGAAEVVLWTHESHRAAGRLYARRGFELTSEAPVEAFGQPTVEQTWRLAL
ncbi:GNAT family N-acetyltransferase [Jannaschia sp. Os4]|uniref:GNAT family N-acetyltransferase n=1 Tax=Jannaschia sp. Os4 TaxID=2807617 RepID=UPI00193A08BA|nr:GNAT family N-acetyltransferase [Jannaschia sp. Os4]MBM2574792.1 GNAT family N-acetyltransferase [Jannaschia sp. Os4]